MEGRTGFLGERRGLADLCACAHGSWEGEQAHGGTRLPSQASSSLATLKGDTAHLLQPHGPAWEMWACALASRHGPWASHSDACTFGELV